MSHAARRLAAGACPRLSAFSSSLRSRSRARTRRGRVLGPGAQLGGDLAQQAVVRAQQLHRRRSQ